MTTPRSDGPLGDGRSYAFDIPALEDEIETAAEHPEYGIDVVAVEAALAEARADLDDLVPEILGGGER